MCNSKCLYAASLKVTKLYCKPRMNEKTFSQYIQQHKFIYEIRSDHAISFLYSPHYHLKGVANQFHSCHYTMFIWRINFDGECVATMKSMVCSQYKGYAGFRPVSPQEAMVRPVCHDKSLSNATNVWS